MKEFKQNKKDLDKELERFMAILDELLPRYSQLLEKKSISPTELTELGDLEYYLIEVNAKITAIKNMLEQDLFGYSLDTFYKLKSKANSGDLLSKRKVENLRENFEKLLKDGILFNMN
jgi:hypothetical protein